MMTDRTQNSRMTDQLTIGACGHTTRLRSYGVRVCTEPAGHDIPPDAPATSTEGWHRHTHTDGTAVCWAPADVAARREAA